MRHSSTNYNNEWRKKNPDKVKAYRKRANKKLTENGYRRKWYAANKEKLLEYNKRRREARFDFVASYKIAKGCSKCGYNKCARSLHFHHKDEKSMGISSAISGWVNIDKIKAEIEKCIILCANCHGELHDAR